MYNVCDKTVMVVGGAGFLGSALVRELLEHGARTVSYDSYLHGNEGNLKGKDLVGSPIVIPKADVFKEGQLRQVIADLDVDYIINCIGDPFVPTAYELPERVFKVNYEGTLKVLMAAKIGGVKRVLHVSSVEVYGTKDGHLISETDALNPINTYGVSKLAADRLCFTWPLEHALPVVIARVFNCYGPRATHRYIIPEIIEQLHKGNTLYLGHLTKRDFTYVHDTAKALIAILKADNLSSQVINVGSGIAYSIKELIYKIADVMGVSNIEIRPNQKQRLRQFDVNCFQCDNKILCSSTNWTPQVGIEEGLHRTVSWFREHGNRWDFSQHDVNMF